MKPRFNIFNYTYDKDVMLCESVAQISKFYEYLDRNGYRWGTGDSYVDHPLSCPEEKLRGKTAVGFHFNTGRWGLYFSNEMGTPSGSYGERFLYYDDFMWDNEDIEDGYAEIDVNELMNLINTTERRTV